MRVVVERDWLNKVHQGNTLDLFKEMPDNFVDVIITSPPYYGLRDYGEETNVIWDGDENCEHEFGDKIPPKGSKSGKHGPGSTIGAKVGRDGARRGGGSQFCQKCGAWKGQLGLEPNLELFLSHLLQITAELKRVLKKSGVFFLNMGDSYGGSGNRSGHTPETSNLNRLTVGYGATGGNVKATKGYEKCMLMQNFRLVQEMVDEQSWILRNIIHWAKQVWVRNKGQTIGSCMPSSIQDRFNVSEEPIFMLTKNQRYYFDLGAVRIPHIVPISSKRSDKTQKWDQFKHTGPKGHSGNAAGHIGGKNLPTVWQVNPHPLPEAHFASFPEALITPLIKAGCPKWVCKKCGHARVRMEEKIGKSIYDEEGKPEGINRSKMKWNKSHPSYNPRWWNTNKTIGWSDCGCNAGWIAGIVLDPFMGSGTSGVVAKKLGRQWIGCELNPDYCRMAEKRISETVEQLELEL